MIAVRHQRCACLALAVLLCLPLSAPRAWELEMAPVTVADTFVSPTWTQVDFLNPFPEPPLVFILPTSDGGDPATLRIRNVTSTGFEVVVTEASGTDGPHVAMPTAYLAIEPGVHEFPDGSRVAAIRRTTATTVSRFLGTSWDTVGLPSGFAGAPAVLASIQTTRSESANPPGTPSVPFLEAAVQNVSASSLQVALERAESTNGSVTSAEDIGILAVESGLELGFIDRFNSAVELKATASGRTVRGWDNGCFGVAYPTAFAATPIVVASMNTRAGNNGGWLRRCSSSAAAVGLTVDEDIDADGERSHTGEAAGVVAASRAFHARFAVDVSISKRVRAVSDPVNGTSNPKSIPSATVEFSIDVANEGMLSPDANTLSITDDIPPNLSLCVSAVCYPGGPVILDTAGSPVDPGISLLAVDYSNDGGLSYGYTPVADGDGFDSSVDAVRITLGGTFAGIAAGGTPSFQLRLAARVD